HTQRVGEGLSQVNGVRRVRLRDRQICRAVTAVQIGCTGKRAGPGVLAREEDATAAEVFRPGDVRAAGGIEVDLEDIRQAAVRAGDRRAKDPERTDPAAGRSVAVDWVGIEQDLAGCDRS